MKNLLLFIVVFLHLNFVISAQFYSERPPSNPSNPLPDHYAGFRRGYFEGYTQSPSITRGGLVQFKISTLAGNYGFFNYTR